MRRWKDADKFSKWNLTCHALRLERDSQWTANVNLRSGVLSPFFFFAAGERNAWSQVRLTLGANASKGVPDGQIATGLNFFLRVRLLSQVTPRGEVSRSYYRAVRGGFRRYTNGIVVHNVPDSKSKNLRIFWAAIFHLSDSGTPSLFLTKHFN